MVPCCHDNEVSLKYHHHWFIKRRKEDRRYLSKKLDFLNRKSVLVNKSYTWHMMCNLRAMYHPPPNPESRWIQNYYFFTYTYQGWTFLTNFFFFKKVELPAYSSTEHSHQIRVARQVESSNDVKVGNMWGLKAGSYVLLDNFLDIADRMGQKCGMYVTQDGQSGHRYNTRFITIQYNTRFLWKVQLPHGQLCHKPLGFLAVCMDSVVWLCHQCSILCCYKLIVFKGIHKLE